MHKLNKTPELRQRHSADIAVIDKEIDELVYRLYGLGVVYKVRTAICEYQGYIYIPDIKKIHYDQSV